MLRKSIFLLYLMLITALSLYPSRGLPHIELFPNADKLIHLSMYAGLTFLMLWAWPGKFGKIRLFIPLFAVVCWGFSMEILQGLMHLGRSFDLTDELANCLGFIPGWIGWRWIGNKEIT